MTSCTQCGAANRLTARFCSRCGMPLTPIGPSAPGAMLHGRYRVLQLLGQGGMGAVYLVEDGKVFGKRWALKEVLTAHLSLADQAQAVQQFQAEAQMLGRLSHPNLPQIADYFSEGGRQYVAMEYVDGDTLEAVLGKTTGFLPERQVIGWAIQLCDVLDYLHNQMPPVIFRDLKPSNIMVTRTDIIKLVDFGIARMFRPGKTKDTTIMGTPGFAAPEQYGSGQTDPRSDIYALGASLHRLLTRHDPATQPFRFPPCRSLNASVSVQLEAAIAKATDSNPSQRFQSAVEMRKALPNSMPVQPKGGAGSSPSSSSMGVVGPTPVQWLQASPVSTFLAYCSVEQQETTWIQEYDGSCTCIECDTSYGVGDLEQVLKAACDQCGIQTTWAISDEKCVCLGCGQEWAISDVSGAIEAYCSQCQQKTPWVLGYTDEYHRLCLWCGQER